MSVDVSQILAKIITDQTVWNDLGNVYTVWNENTIIPYINRIRDIRDIGPTTDKQVLLNTLSILGLDTRHVNGFNQQDLYVLCKDLANWNNVAGTEGGLSFLRRILKTQVTVNPLYSREYCWEQKSLTLKPDLIFVLDRIIHPYFRIQVVCNGSVVPSGALGYVVAGDRLLFHSSYIGKYVTVTYSDFLQAVPAGAKTIEEGGHWFLTTHVEVVSNAVVDKDLFYSVAPLNLVVYKFIVDYNQHVNLKIGAVSNQIVIQRI